MDRKVLRDIWTSNGHRYLHGPWNGPRTVKSFVKSGQNHNGNNQPNNMPKEFAQTRSRFVKKTTVRNLFHKLRSEAK